jgi:hypothetical protein
VAPHGIEVVAGAKPLFGAFIVELLFEGAEHMEAGLLLQVVERSFQERTRAALPRSAIRVLEIAQEEVLTRMVIAKVDVNFRGGIRYEHKIAKRSPKDCRRSAQRR